jgi:hypothetical protein
MHALNTYMNMYNLEHTERHLVWKIEFVPVCMQTGRGICARERGSYVGTIHSHGCYALSSRMVHLALMCKKINCACLPGHAHRFTQWICIHVCGWKDTGTRLGVFAAMLHSRVCMKEHVNTYNGIHAAWFARTDTPWCGRMSLVQEHMHTPACGELLTNSLIIAHANPGACIRIYKHTYTRDKSYRYSSRVHLSKTYIQSHVSTYIRCHVHSHVLFHSPQERFAPSSEHMPPFMRVNPIRKSKP